MIFGGDPPTATFWLMGMGRLGSMACILGSTAGALLLAVATAVEVGGALLPLPLSAPATAAAALFSLFFGIGTLGS